MRALLDLRSCRELANEENPIAAFNGDFKRSENV